MSEEFIHPAEREAERLRVIIETLAATSPDMTMFVAAPTIFEIEKKTADMEKVQWEKDVLAARPRPVITLPDSTPQTAAKFVDLCQEVKDFLPHKKINAIKELRARTGLGLKEAKDGIEWWEKYGTTGPPPASSSGALSPTPANVVTWIDSLPATHPVRVHLTDMMHGTAHSKIKAIKEVRMDCPHLPGLKEAKEGVEAWERKERGLPF